FNDGETYKIHSIGIMKLVISAHAGSLIFHANVVKTF
ncbi:hypothetical protein SAMN05444274_1241, partial [Mariniphaga anaerophila]